MIINSHTFLRMIKLQTYSFIFYFRKYKFLPYKFKNNHKNNLLGQSIRPTTQVRRPLVRVCHICLAY